MQANISASVTPRWLTFQQAAKYTGVCQRTLENWEKAKCFKVSRPKMPGKSKGRTLVDRLSLDAFIESFIDAPPQVIAMNAQKEKAKP